MEIIRVGEPQMQLRGYARGKEMGGGREGPVGYGKRENVVGHTL